MTAATTTNIKKLIKDFSVSIIDGDLSEYIEDKTEEIFNNKKHCSAFCAIDLSDIIAKHELWMRELPNILPFYAVKCNQDPCIVSLLANIGVNFDCSTKAEIQQVLDNNVSPSRIVYANPCKLPEFLSYAAECGVSLMTADNEDELFKIKELYPSAKLLVRMLPPILEHGHYVLHEKFGCCVSDIPGLLKLARKLELEVVGVSFHVGTFHPDPFAFASSIEAARKVFDIAKEEGFSFNMLDIGGGFPGDTGSTNYFVRACSTLRSALDLHFPADSGVQVIAEPGQFYVSSAATIAVQIFARRTFREEYKLFDLVSHGLEQVTDIGYAYYVTVGYFSGFLIHNMGKYYRTPNVVNRRRFENNYEHRSIVFGPTLTDRDVINQNVLLPELQIGDWLMYKDMGSYSVCVETRFSGFPVADRFYVFRSK